METFSRREKFSCFDVVWSPKIVAEMNDQHVKPAKGLGELADEFFTIVSGHPEIHLHDQVVALVASDCFVVPRGVEHRPIANDSAEILLVEPKSTLHTGTQQTAQTVAIEDQEWI